MLHGKSAAEKAEQTARKTFVSGSIGEDLPTLKIGKKEIENGVNIIDLVVLSKLLVSKSEVRRTIKNRGIKINNEIIEDQNLQILLKDFKNQNFLKLSLGKKKHVIIKVGYFFLLIFSIVLVINLGVKDLIGFTVVLIFFGGPFNLKLTPKTPSPVFFPTRISPNIGIDPTNLLIVVAGTSVPLKLINSFF